MIMSNLDLFVIADEDKEILEFAELVGWAPTSINEKFLRQYQETLKLENPDRPKKAGFIRPSSLTECVRKLTFEYTAEPEEFGYDGTPRIGESGTDAHTRIQNYIASMKEHDFDVEFIDVKDYLRDHPKPWLEIIDETANHTILETDIKANKIVYMDGDVRKEKKLNWYMERFLGPETLLYNNQTKSRFKADGIVKYLGKYYVLEIKTENNRKYTSHNKTLEPHDKHKLQGTFYGLSFEIDSVMFLYENRDTCATFVTIFELDEAIKRKVKHLIKETIRYGDNGWIAPRTLDKYECKFCPFQTRCMAIGETPPR